MVLIRYTLEEGDHIIDTESDPLPTDTNIPDLFGSAVKVALSNMKHDKEYLLQLQRDGFYKTSPSFRVHAAGPHGTLAPNGLTESLKKFTKIICKDGGKGVPTNAELEKVTLLSISM